MWKWCVTLLVVSNCTCTQILRQHFWLLPAKVCWCLWLPWNCGSDTLSHSFCMLTLCGSDSGCQTCKCHHNKTITQYLHQRQCWPYHNDWCCHVFLRALAAVCDDVCLVFVSMLTFFLLLLFHRWLSRRSWASPLWGTVRWPATHAQAWWPTPQGECVKSEALMHTIHRKPIRGNGVN